MISARRLSTHFQLEPAARAGRFDPDDPCRPGSIAGIRRFLIRHHHELRIAGCKPRGAHRLQQARTFAPARNNHGQRVTSGH